MDQGLSRHSRSVAAAFFGSLLLLVAWTSSGTASAPGNGAPPLRIGGPDLVVTSVTWQPEDPGEGDYVQVTAVVKNQGDQWADYTETLFRVDGNQWDDYYATSLYPGDSTYVYGHFYGLGAGAHEIQVCADYWSYVYETDETNNCRTESLVVRRMEYYIPSNLSFSPGQDSVVIPIRAISTEDIKAYSIRLKFDPYVFECLDMTVEGTRGADAFLVEKNCGVVGDPSLAVVYRINCPGVGVGDGPVAKLIARVRPSAPLGQTNIYFEDNSPSLNRMSLCDGSVMTPRQNSTYISILPGFVRGDVDANGELNISDPIYNLGYQVGLLPAPHCRDTADDDDSGEINIGDPVYSLQYQFAGGPPLPPPFAACGADPTAVDGLECQIYPPCEGVSSPVPINTDGRLVDVTLAAPLAAPGDLLQVPLSLANRTALWGFEFTLSYDPGRVELLGVAQVEGGRLAFCSGQADPKTGTIRVGVISDYKMRTALLPGDRSLGSLRFRVLQAGGSGGGGTSLAALGMAVVRGRLVDTNFEPIVLGSDPATSAVALNGEADRAQGPGAFGLWSVNPFPAHAVIEFRSPAAGPGVVEIYNALGRRVRTLFSGQVVPGTRALTWDGDSDSGEQLGTGVYFVRASVGAQCYRRMIILTR